MDGRDEHDEHEPGGGGTSRRAFLRGGALAASAAALGTPALAAAASPAARGRGGLPRAGRPGVAFVLSHEQFPATQLVPLGRRAERAGFDHVWASDHIQPWLSNQGHAFHPWQTLAEVARSTSRIGVGSGVTCPLYRHHPSSVAQAFASLGRYAPGRAWLGVGTGEALNELAATGSFGRYPERAARLVEAVLLIRALWSGDPVSYRGQFYRTEQLRIWDLPRELPPIYIAGSGPKAAELAGRYGDGWVCSSKDLMKAELRQAFRRGARAAGKDPDDLPILAETFVVVGGLRERRFAAEKWRFTYDPWTPDIWYDPNPASIRRKARRWTIEQVAGDWPTGTDPEVHVRAMRKIMDMGATPFVHSGQADQERVIDFYGREVLPHLR